MKRSTSSIFAPWVSVWVLVTLGCLMFASPPVIPPVIPDPKFTPGDVLPNITAKDVCVPGYAKKARDVPQSEKNAVYREYGIDPRHHAPTEVDHLCSIEIGGSNSIKNLWPEQFSIVVNGRQEGAKEKDKVEDRIHTEICAGRLTLSQGQQMIIHDWIGSYHRYFGDFPAAVSGAK